MLRQPARAHKVVKKQVAVLSTLSNLLFWTASNGLYARESPVKAEHGAADKMVMG